MRPRSAAQRTLRFAWLLLHVVRGLVTIWLRFPHYDRRQRESAIGRWSQRLLHIVDVELVAPVLPTLDHGAMLVLNHVSWLDVFAVLASTPARFVAKSEIAAWPLIGALVAGVGTLFIRRSSKSHARATTLAVADAIIGGDIVAICPEGTTTAGDILLPFHAALFQPAVDAAALVQPLAIRYEDTAGQRSDAAAYTGDMTLFESVWRIIGTRGLRVRLTGPAAIDARGRARRDLARLSEHAIATALSVPLPTHTTHRTDDHLRAAAR